MTKTRKFACIKCGVPIEVHPPDSIHKYSSSDVNLCDRGLKVEHKCEKCGTTNIIYWCNFVVPEWYA